MSNNVKLKSGKAKIDQKFSNRVLAQVLKHGYRECDIIAIFQVGSSLYLKNTGDIDFKVLVSELHGDEYFPPFTYKGIKCECSIHSLKSWNNLDGQYRAIYIAESNDMKLIYGCDKTVKKYDVLNDKDSQQYLMNLYNIALFNPTTMSKPFEEKRLWNFLLFAFKYKNKSERLTPKQLKVLQQAHDLKVDKEQFRGLFNEMKGEIFHESKIRFISDSFILWNNGCRNNS